MKKIIVFVEKVLALVIVCLLITGCSKETVEYSREISVNQLEKQYLPEGMLITSLSTNKVTVTSKSHANVDSINCKLDFSTCTEEGTCDVYVQCDTEVSIDKPVIQVGVEYLYGKFSEIPEFSNNFTGDEYHKSDEYPLLLTHESACEYYEEIKIGSKLFKCDILSKPIDSGYIEYPTHYIFPNYDTIGTIMYWNGINSPNSYGILHKPPKFFDKANKYTQPEHRTIIEEAMQELEIMAFYPGYFHYYYNEEDCYNRYFFISFETDVGTGRMTIKQYDDLDVAFVFIENPLYEEPINVYVKVHNFFEVVAKTMDDPNIIEFGHSCPIDIKEYQKGSSSSFLFGMVIINFFVSQ